MKSIFRSSLFLLFILPGVAVFTWGQTPASKQWSSFMEWNPGVPSIPEDEELGLLADLRSPNPAWSEALAACQSAFSSLQEGIIPSELFIESLKIPLTIEFERALADNILEFRPRYGLPQRSGKQVDIPIRLDGPETTTYGWVYMVMDQNTWYIQQWALNLTVPTTVPASDEDVSLP